MKLSNTSRSVVEAIHDLFDNGNHDPTKGEIASTLIGSPGISSPYIEGLVGRALPSAIEYLRQKDNIPVVPVAQTYYQPANEDLNTFGLNRKAPKNMPEAKQALAIAGRATWGICNTKANGNGGKFLFQAYALVGLKNRLVAQANYREKLEDWVEHKWLKSGVESLSIEQIDQQLLAN